MMTTTTTMKMDALLCLLFAVISMISMVNCSDDIMATCTMKSLNQTNKTVSGRITLRQVDGGNTTIITGLLTGFSWGGQHGFHIHESGNLSNSCDSAGPHYNPFNTTHGPQTANRTMRHVGDLGNIDVDANLIANFTIVDSIIQLQGTYSVADRAFVVHSGTDDLGKGSSVYSNTTGDSGMRIGCCVIEIDDNSTTTTTAPPPVNVSSTTHRPAGSAVSVGPLVTVSAVCLAAARLIIS